MLAGELIEFCERGVEVFLVENLAAVEHVAFHRCNSDHPPLGVEAVLRGLARRVGDDRSEIIQAMHSLDGMPELVVRFHAASSSAGISPDANDVPRRWSMLTQSFVVEGSSCLLSAA